MTRSSLILLALALPTHSLTAQEKPPPFGGLFKSTPQEFIARFDKNGDNQLAQGELPPFLSRGFERSDRDSNGKLDPDEVRLLLEAMRRFAGVAPKGDGLQAILQKFDRNMDGKIAKEEADGRLAQAFGQFDRNNDGFLERMELQTLVARFAPPVPFRPGSQQPADFDSLDRDANGRLSRQEAAGSSFERTFAAIDTDQDGQLSRRECETYSRTKE